MHSTLFCMKSLIQEKHSWQILQMKETVSTVPSPIYADKLPAPINCTTC